jgi:hypothetical protein
VDKAQNKALFEQNELIQEQLRSAQMDQAEKDQFIKNCQYVQVQLEEANNKARAA